MRIVVIGGGGREHAICWKLSQSPRVEKIFAVPGNDGIKQLPKVECLYADNMEAMVETCKTLKPDLVAIGPEDPLANGLSDQLESCGIKCFGPSSAGAMIESNKRWSKEFMRRNNIPTARFESFTDANAAKKFIRSADYDALVVKASGLAAGKGVIVANTLSEAEAAVNELLEDKKFGSAGDEIVVEEKLSGEEISVLAFVDRNTVEMMLPSQDHKRLLDNDEGPNTGGMGAYCPCSLISNDCLEFVRTQVMQRAVDGLRNEGISYRGVLYAGIMLTPTGPQVLEFNCRFGDPETEVLLPLLKTDLVDIMLACCNDSLNQIKLEWIDDLFAVGVVIASAKYPESSTKGCIIKGLPDNSEKLITFHMGTKSDSSGNFLTNGGRVLVIVGLDHNLKAAADQVTKICENVTFLSSHTQFRKDIARKATKLFSLSYKDSGVDIDAGDALVKRIKLLAKGTHRKGVVGGIGGFGGLLSLEELAYKNPVLCEVTNGVKAKVKLAIDFEMYENVGHDLVAMCVNDILECGAEPVAFLDYMACGKLQVPVAAQIIKGISDACRESHCALLGGETAEMPSMYKAGEYDMAGYCLGILESGLQFPRLDEYKEGDVLVGLLSNGFHCVGLDIIYEIIKKSNLNPAARFGSFGSTLGQEILKPSSIYVKNILKLIEKQVIKSVVHVNSGLMECIEKIIPDGYHVDVDAKNIPFPKLQVWFANKGGLMNENFLNYFNCGIGLLFVVAKEHVETIKIPNMVVISKIQTRKDNKKVIVHNLEETLYILRHGVSASVQYSTLEKDKLSCQVDLSSRDLDRNKINKNTKNLTNLSKRLTHIPDEHSNSILVIGTDGVGTKLKVAQEMKIHNSVGIDLVAMCVNDILCNGAVPLTFSAYNACGRFSSTINDVTSGIIEGCRQAECELKDMVIEEMPLLYSPMSYDIAGFALGITKKENMLPKISEVRPGDIVIGLPSMGVHSNGFSLVHKIIETTSQHLYSETKFGKTLGEELLRPTQIYVDAIKPLINFGWIKAAAHITGGGLLENIPRVLTETLKVDLDARKFNIPPIIAWLADKGAIQSHEMLRTYNCGLGLVLIIDPIHLSLVMRHLEINHRGTEIGVVTNRNNKATPQVTVSYFQESLTLLKHSINRPKKRIGVLISGSGSNLQAIIDATRDSVHYTAAEVVLVISNKADAYGLTRAAAANIPGIFISHKEFESREDFDDAMTKQLELHKVDVICLAGFMRLLSTKFVRKWKGKLINVHPSLLPKHPGLHVQQKALDAGDTESGCTIHFVDEGVDTGAIILQTRVPILPSDDVTALTDRIHSAEHFAYPLALKLVCTEMVKLTTDGRTVWAN